MSILVCRRVLVYRDCASLRSKVSALDYFLLPVPFLHNPKGFRLKRNGLAYCYPDAFELGYNVPALSYLGKVNMPKKEMSDL